MTRARLTKCLPKTIVFLLIFCYAAVTAAQTIPILVYHRFDSALPGPTTVRTAVFESQLIWLEEHNRRVVPLHTAIDAIRSHIETGTPAVVITVDDGHRSVYSEMFPLILKRQIPVTLFIYPSAISKAAYALTWEQIRRMQKSGLVEVQSHTYWHPNFRKERARLNPTQYAAFVKIQMERSRKVLESRLDVRVDALSWPFGIYDSYLEEAARQAGYQAAFAYEGGPAHAGCDEFAIPRIPVSDLDIGLRFSKLLSDSPSAQGTK